MLRIIFGLFCLLASCVPLIGFAQSYEQLSEPFEPSLLLPEEKRFLQVALAMEGSYIGLFDGDWGNLSQTAMESYAAEEFGTRPQMWHMSMLAFLLVSEIDVNGWRMNFHPDLSIGFLFPEKTAQFTGYSGSFENWEQVNSSLAISMARTDRATMLAFHDWVSEQDSGREPPYYVRRDTRLVSQIVMPNGLLLYARSDFVNGGWSTMFLSSNQQDRSYLMAVAGSISIGASEPIVLPEYGELSRSIELTFAMLDEETYAEPSPYAANTPPNDPYVGTHPASSPPGTPVSTTGTGFLLNDTGHVLTNAHVVEDCLTLTVGGAPAQLVRASDTFDLAVIHAPDHSGRPHAVFAPTPIRLNSDVTVVGFPLSELLSGLNVTRGAVTSLAGLYGDEFTMQISAPVQPGNSGGPVLDEFGAVVGVVVSKLDAQFVADATGDIPQNVNFAVRGEIAKLFLSQAGLAPTVSKSDLPLSGPELAERAAAYTMFIECN